MTVASMDARPVRRIPRWLIAALAVSLLLNGLVLGAIGARLWAAKTHHSGWRLDNTHFGIAVTLPPSATGRSPAGRGRAGRHASVAPETMGSA